MTLLVGDYFSGILYNFFWELRVGFIEAIEGAPLSVSECLSVFWVSERSVLFLFIVSKPPGPGRFMLLAITII